MTLLLQILFFGISLQTYYFYSVGLPVISIAALFLMGLVLFASSWKKDIRLPKNLSTGVAAGYVFILFWSAAGLLFYGDLPDLKGLISFPTIILAVFIGVTLFQHVSLEKIVRFYLVIHVSFFLVQFFVYYITGHVIDYLAPITGESQRMLGGSFNFPIIKRFMRAAGLFNEPGTYATFIAPFVALFERWYDNSKVNKRVFWLSLSSLFLSLSAFGIVFGGLIFLFSKNIRKLHRIYGAIVLGAFALPSLYNRFVLRPSLGLSSGMDIRENFLAESWNFLLSDTRGFTFGSNLLVLNPRVEFAMSSTDIGLWGYFLHFAGIPLTLLIGIILLYIFIKSDPPSRLALLIVVLSKASPFWPFFPLTMVAIFWQGKKSHSHALPTKIRIHTPESI